MTRCSLKVLEPEELMDQDLDVDNLYVASRLTHRAVC